MEKNCKREYAFKPLKGKKINFKQECQVITNKKINFKQGY